MDKTLAAALVAVLAAAIVPATLQKAFAHAHTEVDVPASQHPAGKKISFVLGHTAEPTFGAEPGIHDGMHNMEILLRDSATKLPLTGADLKADKYYFKDVASFNKAGSVNDADEIAKNVTVSSVFGDPGHYMVRQVQAPRIYGYHVYGTIDYFKVAQITVNTTVFCRAADVDTSKFNSPGWAGGFGCTDGINDIAFPKDTISGKDDGQRNDHKAAVKIAAVDANGQALHVHAKIQQGGKILRDGFTPLTFNGSVGQTYQISIANFGGKQFAQWEDGSTAQRGRTITLSSGATFTAKFANTTKTSYDDPGQRSEAQMKISVTYGYAASSQTDAVANAGAIAKNSGNASLAQILAVGIPVAAAASVFAWRSRRKDKD